MKLGVTALVWVGIEDGLERCGQPWVEARELGAGVGTASIFALVCKLPRCLQCTVLTPTIAVVLSRPTSVAFGSSSFVSRRSSGWRDGVPPMG